MAEDKKISFSAVDNGVSNFMKRMQQDTKALYSEFAAEARKQSSSQKEQLKLIEAQIKALEKANQLEREHNKIILERKLSSGAITPAAFKAQMGRLNQDTSVGRYQAGLLRDFNEPGAAKGSITSPADFIKASQAEAAKLQAETQGKGKTILSDFAKIAQEQTKSQKEQSKLIHDQINALETKLKKQRESLRMVLEEKAATADGKDKEIIDEELGKIHSESKRDKVLIEEMREQQRERDKGIKPDSKASVFNDIMKAGALRDLFALARQFPNADTGLDFVSPGLSIAGGAAGGLAGNALDAVKNLKVFGTGLGDTQFGVLGTQLGKDLGGFFGDAITRSFRTREQFDAGYSGFKGLTGMNSGTRNMAFMGFDDIKVAQMMLQVAQAAGTGMGANRNASGVFGLHRGYNISEGDSLAAIGLQRSGAGSGVTNMQRGLGVAIAEGISRTRLGDVIRNQTALLQQFSMTNTNVSADMANRNLFEFNRMGGMFSMGDPRSISNIQAINNDLSNPGSPFAQAMNYSVLRRLNPNAGVFQLMKLQEQGLQTPDFLKGVIGDVSGMGGSEDFQKLMLKGRLPSLSFEAVDTLFNNRGALGSMSQSDLDKMLGSKTIESQASDLTTTLMKNQADVTNAFRADFMTGITEVEQQFEKQMKSAIDEIADYLKNKILPDDEKKDPLKKDAAGTYKKDWTTGKWVLVK